MKKWYLGSSNDALYIVDVPPSPTNDYPDHERDTGLTLAICVHGLPDEKAKEIVTAHNKVVAELAALRQRVVPEGWVAVPTVKRATGRTIPDLTNKEHVCGFQNRVVTQGENNG